MGDVADRFFHTPAGRQAANRLASRHIDRGRLGLAAFWLSRLLEAGDPVAGAAAWRLKAAWVFHRVGQPERVKTLLADLTDAGRLRIPGVGEVGRDEWLGASRPAILPEPVLVDWPVFYGSPARRGRAEGGAPLLLSRWHRRWTHRHAVAAVVRELVEDLDDLGRPMIPAFVPLVVGNKAIFRTLLPEVEGGRGGTTAFAAFPRQGRGYWGCTHPGATAVVLPPTTGDVVMRTIATVRTFLRTPPSSTETGLARAPRVCGHRTQ